MLLTLFFTLISFNLLANDAVTTMSDYAKHSMTELAASPPLLLLENKNGQSRHEIVLGYIKTSVDDNATLSGGTTAKEKGDADGFGLGYGHSKSFKDKWGRFFWIQAAQQSGSHDQTVNSTTTATIKDMETVNLNLAIGISYEFLRNLEKHVLNLFVGPSLTYLEVSGAINTYNTSGNQTAAFDASYDGLLPSVMFGLMYEYKFIKNFQVVPYALLNLSLADECQQYRVDNVSLSDANADANSPECGGGKKGTVDGETDIAPSFASIGIKFNYVPWNIGFNISGLIRDAFLRSDNEQRAQVKGAFLSLSKSW